MDLRSLRYFVAVVDQQGFSRAAEFLHVTQPTVSKMIAQLEQSLDLVLLERTGKRFTLTDAGQVVLTRGRAMLAMHEELQVELADLQQLRRGELRLGVTQQAHQALAPLLAAYNRQYPDVELKLFEDGTQAIETNLRNGTLEMGSLLDYAGNAHIWTEFDSLPLATSPLCVLAPLDAAWHGRPAVALRELADSSFIFYGASFALNEIVADACASAGFKPRISGRSGQWDFVASLVRLGVGIAVLPKLFCDTLPAGQFTITTLTDPQIDWKLRLAWRSNSHLSFAARAWLTLATSLQGHMATHRAEPGSPPSQGRRRGRP
ncbi:LysR substrate-binding domain-containing protein [Duganella sp. Leaf126]|uniref:LysR substrate-binding domain-containing protein n=1 Tax=Duganella sp. Leaf126 TaxID=1736266 RepID=UPI0009E90932|nr:LysR substrate-binding domain-containing protein [Duganella sp. Leaf126]